LTKAASPLSATLRLADILDIWIGAVKLKGHEFRCDWLRSWSSFTPRLKRGDAGDQG